MKNARVLLLALLLGMGLCLGLAGCETSKPGVTRTAGSFEMLVDATPAKATAAAAQVLKDIKLLSVDSASTSIDGKVTAKTAQGKPVAVAITSKGDNVSNIEVQVGGSLMGDEALSMQILDAIHEKLK